MWKLYTSIMERFWPQMETYRLADQQVNDPGQSPALAVAARPAGHAPFDHAHVVLPAAWAGFATTAGQVDDLCLRVGFQPHASAPKEPA